MYLVELGGLDERAILGEIQLRLVLGALEKFLLRDHVLPFVFQSSRQHHRAL